MREFIKFVKKLLENKRTRSLAILLLYLIFFIFVFTFLSTATFKNPNDTNDLPNDQVDEFEYLKNIQIINYQKVENLNYDLISPIIIYNIVKNSDLESTNYLEGSNTYRITVSKFYKVIYNMDVDNSSYIKISIYENKINLDFSNCYGYTVNLDIRS